MVGRKVDRPPCLFRPASDGWEHWQKEPWKLCGMGSSSLEEVVTGKDAYLALPARLVISAPLWFPQADLSLVKEMARVELDMRGLLPKQEEPVLTVRVICTVQERMLICAQIFPSSLPASFSHPAFGFFNASPLFVGLEADSLHLWREGADVVAVFTRGEEALYWETIPFQTPNSELLSWLECIGLMLVAEGILELGLGFVNFLSANLATPSFCTGSIVTERSSPPLREQLPACPWKSRQRRTLEKELKARTRFIQVAAITGGVYLSLLAVFAGWIGEQHWKAARLHQKIRTIEPEIRNLQQARRQWNILAPTVESSRFPMEILHFIVRQMPPEEKPSKRVCLTQFEFNHQKLGIQGEAKSISDAARFFTSIRTVKEVSYVDWEMPPPTLLPNNTARFAISGTIIDESN